MNCKLIVFLAAFLTTVGTLKAEPDMTHNLTTVATKPARDEVTNPRVQWKEFDRADTRMFFIAGLHGKMDSTGTLRVTYSTRTGFEPIRSAIVQIGDKSYQLNREFFPFKWLVTNFPAKAPFEKDTDRTLNLDFRITSDGGLDDTRAFASLKPTRDMYFHCQWGEGDPIDHGAILKVSEDAKTATAEVYKGNNNIVPGVNGSGAIEYTSSGKNGLQLNATWPDGKLTIEQDKNQSRVFHGEFKIGPDIRTVSCAAEKND